MKQLKFEHKPAELIQTGDKTVTLRVNDDKNLVAGDDVEVVDKVDRDKPSTWTIPGVITITSTEFVALGDLSEEHLLKSEVYGAKEELVRTFRRFYGEFIDEKTLVKVLNFKFKQYDKAKKYLEYFNKAEQKSYKKLKLFADGGSRGNPGPSALGYIVYDEGNQLIHSDNKYIGLTTNNQAEYHAMIAGLEWCIAHGAVEITVNLDSMLVVNQMKGSYKVKNRDLWSLYETARELVGKVKKVRFNHVPRELNKLADAEVNKALDAVKGSDVVQ